LVAVAATAKTAPTLILYLKQLLQVTAAARLQAKLALQTATAEVAVFHLVVQV
jgi:hypothetical protein